MNEAVFGCGLAVLFGLIFFFMGITFPVEYFLPVRHIFWFTAGILVATPFVLMIQRYLSAWSDAHL